MLGREAPRWRAESLPQHKSSAAVEHLRRDLPANLLLLDLTDSLGRALGPSELPARIFGLSRAGDSADSGSATALFMTPCSRGYCEVKIEKCEGRVRGIGANAFRNKVPARASSSMNGVGEGVAPYAPM